MDSFEINKIVAAILLVALLIIGISKISNVIFHVEKPETPGYAVEVEQVSSNLTNSAEEVEEKIDSGLIKWKLSIINRKLPKKAENETTKGQRPDPHVRHYRQLLGTEVQVQN